MINVLISLSCIGVVVNLLLIVSFYFYLQDELMHIHQMHIRIIGVHEINRQAIEKLIDLQEKE